MDNDLKLSQFLDAWGHDDVALAQEILTAHNWDVESALLAVSEVGDSNGSQVANPGAYEHASGQQEEVDADGYRAPMRTGYTDRLIGPDPMDFGGMSLDEQAAMVAAMTGGQAAAAAAQEEDAALQAMQASSCEFERLADQREQGFLAEAMQQSYAMAMAQERQRMESFHEAERAEQEQMAKAIEESFREQSKAEAKFREELDKAIADSAGHAHGQGQVPHQQYAPAPSAGGHSSSSAGHSRHASRPGSACSSSSNHRQPLPQQSVGRMGSAASHGTSPSSSTGFAQHSTGGAAAAAAYPPRLPGSSAGSGSSTQPGRLSSEVVGRSCGQSSRPVDPSQRRPSKNALPPASGYGQRATPPPPPANSQGRPINAETANAERVVSSTRLTKQSAGPSVNGTASAINRPGVRTGPSRMNHGPVNSRHADSGSASQELPGEERSLRSQGSGSFQRSGPGGGAPAAAAAAAPSRPIKLDARIECTGSRGELPVAANNPIVRAGATMSTGSPKHHAPPPLHSTSSNGKASHRPAAFPQPGASSSTSAGSQSSSSMAHQQQQQHHPHQHYDRRREQQVLSTKQQMDAEQQHLAEIRRREIAETQQREVQRQEAEEIRRREAAAAAEEEARRRAAEELRRREAEELRRRETEELRRREAEELRKREAEELRRREAEELRRRDAEEQRAREAEQRGVAELARRRQQIVAEQRQQASVQSAQKDSAAASQQGQLRERDVAGQVSSGGRPAEENGRPLRSGAEKRSASQARAAAAAEARAVQAAAQAATAATPAENPLSQQQLEDQRRKDAHEAELARREAEEAAMRAQQTEDKDKDKAKDEVVASLGSLWKAHREHNPQALAAGLTALRTYIGNLAKNPQDPKFHRINVDNQAFKTRVASLEGAVAVLHACGFAEDETGALVVGEAFLKSKGSKLFSALDKLNVMLDQLGKQG